MVKAGMLREETRDVEGKEQAVNVGVIPVASDSIFGRISAHDIVDEDTGEILVECNEELTEDAIALLREAGVNEVETLYIDNVIVGSFLRDTLLVDKVRTTEDAIVEIYRRLRPGDPPTRWRRSTSTTCSSTGALISARSAAQGEPQARPTFLSSRPR